MAGYITLGRFNKRYFFILGSIIVRVILSFISGFTPYLTPNNTIFIFGFNSNFFSHPIISYVFQYISLFLGGLLLEFIIRRKNRNLGLNINKKEMILISLSNNINVKHNKSISIGENSFKDNNKKYFLQIFLIFSLYYFAKVAMTSLDNLGYNRVKYWPLEFIFLYIFSKKKLNKIIYKHQKLSLGILMIVCLTIYIINSFIPKSNKDCSLLSGEEKEECELLVLNIYEDIFDKFGWFFIPIMILIYLAAMVSNAYSSISFKWFMDFKYITLSRVLIYIGLIGSFYSLILLFILSNMPCLTKENNILSYVCKLDYNGELFYENYKTLENIKINSTFYIDVFILIPLYVISSFLSIFFELLIIKDLDPFYLIPIDCIYFLLYDIIDYCITYSITNLYRNLKFICQFCSNTIAVFLCCIYVEIIELHFCSLDLYLRRYIIKRGQKERMNSLKDFEEFNELGAIVKEEQLNESVGSYII